jgi:hypothetical protein
MIPESFSLYIYYIVETRGCKRSLEKTEYRKGFLSQDICYVCDFEFSLRNTFFYKRTKNYIIYVLLLVVLFSWSWLYRASGFGHRASENLI